jgi:hypothetical protein
VRCCGGGLVAAWVVVLPVAAVQQPLSLWCPVVAVAPAAARRAAAGRGLPLWGARRELGQCSSVLGGRVAWGVISRTAATTHHLLENASGEQATAHFAALIRN